MKRFFRLFSAVFALMVLGAVNVNAEEISLQEVPFWTHEVWGVDEPKNTPAECIWVVGESTDLPYGDSNVINFADLSAYTKLVVTVTDGTPRFLMNRDVDEGQFSDNEAESHLIDNTRGGWCAKYFSQDGNTYTVDLKQLVKDKGFAHLHAIKGANWSNITVESMVVVSAGKAQQIGWTSIINNGNLEGDDVSSFFVALDAVNNQGYEHATIVDGVGVDGSRGIQVTSIDNPGQSWATQFFVRFNEPLLPDARWRISFSYRADKEADCGTGCHGEPRAYKAGGLFNGPHFTPDWQTFTTEGTVSEDQGKEGGLLSIAFDLNTLAEANNYYFDNIKFDVYKAGTTAEFSNDVILLNFGFDTNVGQLVKASGAKRIFFDKSCALVKVNGTPAELYSIEGFEDGRLYIFLDSPASEGDEVEVTFNNPAGEYHLVYTSGPNIGADVPNFQGVATPNSEIEDNEGYPYDYVTPTVMKADPEDGSFNLPNSTEFKVYFDKNVDCGKLVATANGQNMTVSPASGFAKEITLSAGSLPDGVCTIKLTKIYPQLLIDESVFGEYEYIVNIGQVIIDPNDMPYNLISTDAFENCAENAIPEGFQVKMGDEVRIPGQNYSGGSRMFVFADGGDFKKGLYFREGYVETFPALSMQAGKKYVVTFNGAMWKGTNKVTFQVLNANEDVLMEESYDCKPDMNGAKNAVVGSTAVETTFVPETDGDYTLRWVSDGFVELLLANVQVQYQPNIPGLKETLALQAAVESAKKTLEGNSGERYEGAAYNNLQNVIAQYDGGWQSSAPSAYQDAIDALNAAAQGLKDHRSLCDEYDTQVKAAIDVIRQNEMPNGDPEQATKFVSTDLFTQLKSIVAKYNGASEWVNLNEDPEGEAQWQLNYTFDVLKDDAQLTVAVAELKSIATTTSLLFTVGESKCSETGVKVLIERLRQGAEALKSLGAGDDYLVAMANNALADDDRIADDLKTRITHLVYGLQKDNLLFTPVIDETTLEETTPEYNLTVFVKNPNIYKQLPSLDFTSENVPGWETPAGFNTPGLTAGWNAPKNIEGVAEDVMFQTWASSYRVEQTVTDLPVGVYTIVMGFGERDGEGANEGNLADSYIYAKTTDTPEGDYAGKTDAVHIGQSYPVLNSRIEGITVTDGILTIGVNAGSASHTFFNDVCLLLTAPVNGYDYAKAFEDGIETLDVQPAAVRSVELFDVNGRRVATAQRGVTIVKKQMSDGTIVTSKVVRK